MKIPVILLIDDLGPGGAPRQLCTLASALTAKGYSAEVACYHKNMWFEKYLAARGIPVRLIEWKNRIDKIWQVRKFLRGKEGGVVISFLRGANMLNILSSFPVKKHRMIVSERTTQVRPISLRDRICFFLFNFADRIIVNSKSQMDFLSKKFPRLAPKMMLIQNGIDLDIFSYNENQKEAATDRMVFGVFASYVRMKRLADLILAVENISRRLEDKKMPRFVWYGEYKNPFSGRNYTEYEDGLRLISEKRLEKFFDLRGPTDLPDKELQKMDCVCLVSDQEGFPNSICEAFACGKPVVATRVGDIPHLVTEGRTGFLAEPHSPESIASALLKMISLSREERLSMGRAARTYAEKNLSVERFCKQYMAVIGEPVK